jgi:hypothetical protein
LADERQEEIVRRFTAEAPAFKAEARRGATRRSSDC